MDEANEQISLTYSTFFLEKPDYFVEGASEEDSPFENFNCSYGLKNTCIIIQNFSCNKHVL